MPAVLWTLHSLYLGSGGVPDGCVPDGGAPPGGVPEGAVPFSIPSGGVPEGAFLFICPPGGVPDGAVLFTCTPGCRSVAAVLPDCTFSCCVFTGDAAGDTVVPVDCGEVLVVLVQPATRIPAMRIADAITMTMLLFFMNKSP